MVDEKGPDEATYDGSSIAWQLGPQPPTAAEIERVFTEVSRSLGDVAWQLAFNHNDGKVTLLKIRHLKGGSPGLTPSAVEKELKLALKAAGLRD
jgi:hypothetical protein